ncbi:MFS transporter [Chitinophaga skermanii]|nr:MFS transporter [Chitinophaga skermanii]
MQKGLLALAVGGFGIGMTEFVMMGILPDLASSLHITIPQAGHFISAYALGVVVGAPLLTAIGAKYTPNKVLIMLMLWFTVFNTLSAFSPNYYTLLTMRFLSGLPHGAFFGIGAVVAGKLAAEGKAAQAISIMFTGLTVANIIGVPLGTYIGHSFDWRITFGAVGIIGILAMLSIYSWMPAMEKEKQSQDGSSFQVFKQVELWLIVLLTTIGTGGFFAWYSYIAPLLTDITHIDPSMVTYVLVIAGVGMSFGNIAGAKLADKYSPVVAVIFLLLFMTAVLLTLTFVASSKPLTFIMTFIIGATAFSIVAPIQMMMIKSAKGAEMLGSSITQGAFNIGNALGAYLGGIPLTLGYSFTSPDVVGAGMALGGVLIAVTILVLRNKKVSTPVCAEC